MPRVIDKSEKQKGAEADVESFRAALGPFVVAAETTRMAMIFTDAIAPGNPIIFANDSFLALSGYDREEVLGQRFDFLLEGGAEGADAAKITAEFEGDAGALTDFCFRSSSGAVFWSEVYITPVRNGPGEIIQHFASFVDVSEYRERIARSAMLIDELNHRVKNTLATVRSIVSQGLRTSGSMDAITEAIESRLFALSRSHDLLARENWASAGLLDLANEALKPFGKDSGRSDRFVVGGENIRLPPNTALALGIAFHELATNAVKYGALSNAEGSVQVAWAVESSPNGDRLRLRWGETDGPAVAAPARKGFGSRVIERGLGHELAAETHLDYHRDGLICTIDIPAPNGARDDKAVADQQLLV